MKPPKKKNRARHAALVRWFDSSITHGGTVTPAEAAGVLENESFGLVIAEDRVAITLALDRCIQTGGVRCTLCIPWVNVRRLKRFPVGAEEE